MRLLTESLSRFIRRYLEYKYNDIRSNYIFYKIVDSTKDEEFILQCINTNALFYAKITDIVFDIDILKGLHPIQSCFIGIEYAKYIKKNELDLAKTTQKIHQYSLNRYGCYTLCYQNRNKELCFINNITSEQFIMDPRDISLSEELIIEFDATQAFYVGLLAGLKINKQTERYSKVNRAKLYLVKL